MGNTLNIILHNILETTSMGHHCQKEGGGWQVQPHQMHEIVLQFI